MVQDELDEIRRKEQVEKSRKDLEDKRKKEQLGINETDRIELPDHEIDEHDMFFLVQSNFGEYSYIAEDLIIGKMLAEGWEIYEDDFHIKHYKPN